MAVWPMRYWEHTDDKCKGQFIASKKGHTYHDILDKNGRLNWKLLSPKKCKQMYELASGGVWMESVLCCNLLVHAEMIRQGKKVFAGFNV